MTLWIGADWDKEKCVLSYRELGDKRLSGKVLRNPSSVQDFMSRLGGGEVVVGIEAGDPFWAKLWRQAGVTVHVFDGNKARRYSESLIVTGARDDRRSADHLLEMVQSKPHRAADNDELPEDLQSLSYRVETHDDASNDAVRFGNRLRSHLRQLHPAFAEAITAVDARWVRRALALAPTPRAWAELSSEAQGAALKGVSKSRRRTYAAALGTDYGAVSPVEEQAARAKIRAAVAMLSAACESRDCANKALMSEGRTHSTAVFLQSMPGIGVKLGGGVTLAVEQARVGEQDRDGAARVLGMVPVTSRSGTLGDRAPLVSMRRSSRTLMRKIGHLLGAQLVARHRWAKAQYAHYRSQGKSGFSSYRRVVRSFLRVVGALLRDDVAFDEQRYIAALKVKRVEWAMAL